MNQKILQYKTFTNNNELVDWQEAYPLYRIVSITPYIHHVDLHEDGVDLETSVTVVYVDETPEEE